MNSITLLALAGAAYVFLRVIYPLPIRWWGKLIIGGALAATALCFKVMQHLGGALFAPDLPGPVVLGYSWLWMVLLLYFLLLLLLEPVRLLLWLLRRRHREPERSRRRRYAVHAGLLVIVLGVCGIGLYNATKLPEVRSLELPGEAPLRIAMLTDLHADAVKGEAFFRGIVERTNALQPDIIVITGDLVDGSVARRGKQLEPLRDLKARWGVYGVPGNHDYFSGYDEWLPFLQGLGIRMLNNEHVVLPGEKGAVIAGTTDPAARLYGHPEPNVQQALHGAPAGRQVILLTHQPQVAKQARQDILLQLSGHTHGGLMPGFAELTARYNCGWVSGLYEPDRATTGCRYVYVSNGTSLWSGMPLRLAVPAEITLITLTPADTAE